MNVRILAARYAGHCKACAATIRRGDVIAHAGRGQAYCLPCADAIDRGETDIVATYFPTSGETVYRNRRGRCIDAPCCGCCS